MDAVKGSPMMIEPDGVKELFMEGISIVKLAKALKTDPAMIEASLRESIRKRESIEQASTDSAAAGAGA